MKNQIVRRAHCICWISRQLPQMENSNGEGIIVAPISINRRFVSWAWLIPHSGTNKLLAAF